MRTVSKYLSGSLAVLFLVGVLATPCFAEDETLNNASIIEMQSMSLGDAVIVDKIKTSKCDFDTSMTGLKKLKAAKISDTVIQAMLATKNSTPAPAEAPAKAATKSAPASSAVSGDVSAMHSAGVYMMQGKKLVRLDTEASGETTHDGNHWAMGWGASSKTSIVLSGSKSGLQLTDRKPVFYFYLGRLAHTDNDYGTPEYIGIEDAKEVILAQFTQKTAKGHDERLLVTGSHNAYAGSTWGIETKAQRPFDAEKVADGIFKVTPREDLPDGEFCFSVATSHGYGRFFTFGVKGD